MNKFIKLASLMVAPLLLLSTGINNQIKNVKAEEYVCTLTNTNGTVEYSSVFSAFEAATELGGTIKLTSNANESWKSSLTFGENADVIFDLNGHTYTENLTDERPYYARITKSFTLTDTSTNKSGVWKSFNDEYSNKLRLVQNGNGTINLNQGTVSNFSPLISTDGCEDGTINVNGGTFNSSILTNANKNVTFNINGGSFNAESYAVSTTNYNLTYNINAETKGYSFYAIQSSLKNNELSININEKLTQDNSNYNLVLVHDIYQSIDGLVLANIKEGISVNSLSFHLQILDTYNSTNKLSIDDWKIVTLDNQLVIKNKDYVVPVPVENKKVISDSNGNSATFIGDFTSDDLVLLSKAQLIVNYVSVTSADTDLIASTSKYSKYDILKIVEVSLLDGENNTLKLSDVSTYYVTIRLESNIELDNYVVVDSSINKYTTTFDNGNVTFETSKNGKYLILGTGTEQVNYLLGAIIPLSIILLLEIAYIIYYFVNKSKKNMTLAIVSPSFLYTVLWAGAIPMIIIESCLILGLTAYIVLIFVRNRKKK